LTVVFRVRPEWVSICIGEAARKEKVNPERLSRICSKAIGLFQQALDGLTRIGRPTRKKKEALAADETALLRALLGVATAILKHVSFRKPAIRALIVGAYLRLKETHSGLTKKYFCQALALSERTFRHWMKNAEKAPSKDCPVVESKKKPKRKRAPRRPRFGFQVTLPDTQLAADTTDIQAFGVPLKLVAAQDIGGREQDLLDSIIIDDRESADHVIRAVTNALDGKQGVQVLTDQGTPYMADATLGAFEELEAEHAPQKEGHPQGKATVERAFGTIKTIAAPILELTQQIAKALPTLNNPDLAKAAATLLLTALLKAYQAGARATQRADAERAGVSKEDLAELALESRENAVSENRSIRLLLKHIHRDYDIKKPIADFIRQMRRFGLDVLIETEKRFAAQVHREDIRDRASYFAAIARRVSEEQRRRKEIEHRQKERDRKSKRHRDSVDSRNEHWQENPATWLRDALLALAKQWIPDRNQLLLGGAGIGRAWLISAIDRLIELNEPVAAKDIALGLFKSFEAEDPEQIGPLGILAIKDILEKHLPKKPTGQTDFTGNFGSTILRNNGP
jgi:transposase InsO family protein